MDMRFLSTKVHGAIDYIVGLALILAPMIFSFQDIGGAAVYVPIILGVSLIVYSMLTRYEWGVFKLISMYYHMVLDVVVAVLLILSPFLFGFVNEAPKAWLPHVLVGIVFVTVILFSETEAHDKMVTS
jgi:hypothetical protein